MHRGIKALTALALTFVCITNAAAAAGILKLPESLKSLGAEAFSGVNTPTEIVLPEGVATIESRALADMTITGINLPESLTYIAPDAFEGAELSGVEVAWGSYAKAWCDENGVEYTTNGIQEETPASSFIYTLADGEVSITRFIGSEKEVVIPSEIDSCPVVMLGNSAFSSAGVTGVVVPDTVTQIGSYCFSGCTELVRVEIQTAVLGNRVFQECSSSLVIVGNADSATEAYARENGIGFVDRATGELLFDYDYGYRIENNRAIVTAYTGKETELVFPKMIDGYPVTAIDRYTAANNSRIKSVTIPQGVAEIGVYAFQNNTNLTTVHIAQSVRRIYSYAFSGCTSLSEIIIPAGVGQFGVDVFSNCSDGFIIKGYAESEAQRYAEQYGHVFAELEDETTGTEKAVFSVVDGEAWITEYACTAVQEEIPDELDGYPVTRIWDHAFAEETYLKELKLPDLLTYIGEGAFAGCKNLHTVHAGGSIMSVGPDTFKDCSADLKIYGHSGALEEYALENGIAFEAVDMVMIIDYEYTISGFEAVIDRYVGSAREITLPSRLDGYPVTAIGEGAFRDCTLLEAIKLADTINKVNENAFAGCSNLKRIDIPGDISSMPVTVFDEAHEDLVVYGKNSSVVYGVMQDNPEITFWPIDTGEAPVLDYKYQVFDGEVRITDYRGNAAALEVPVMVGDYPVTEIYDYALSELEGVVSITLPQGIESIGRSSFYSSRRLTEMTIPGSIEAIGDSAFQACTGLKNVTICEGVNSIGGYAFTNCSALEYISIPESVNEIADDAFLWCDVLTIIGLAESYAQAYAQEKGVAFEAIEGGLSGDFEYVIENNEAVITRYTGAGGAVNIPQTIAGCAVTAVGSQAFWGTQVTKITVPEGILHIESGAFGNCAALTEVVLPETAIQWGDSLFAGDAKLASVNIPAGVTTIRGATFIGCQSLTDIEMPEEITTIGPNAFYGCTGLMRVEIPESVVSIGSGAFTGCGDGLVLICPEGSASHAYAEAEGIAYEIIYKGPVVQFAQTEVTYAENLAFKLKVEAKNYTADTSLKIQLKTSDAGLDIINTKFESAEQTLEELGASGVIYATIKNGNNNIYTNTTKASNSMNRSFFMNVLNEATVESDGKLVTTLYIGGNYKAGANADVELELVAGEGYSVGANRTCTIHYTDVDKKKPAGKSGTKEEYVASCLDWLEEKYPSGKYWNHWIGTVHNPHHITGGKCHLDVHESNNSIRSSSWYKADENHLDIDVKLNAKICNAYPQWPSAQCCGFAMQVTSDMFGTCAQDADQWTTYYGYPSGGLQPGDCVYINDGGSHYFVVTAVHDTYVETMECNQRSSGNPCVIFRSSGDRNDRKVSYLKNNGIVKEVYRYKW